MRSGAVTPLLPPALSGAVPRRIVDVLVPQQGEELRIAIAGVRQLHQHCSCIGRSAQTDERFRLQGEQARVRAGAVAGLGRVQCLAAQGLRITDIIRNRRQQ
jgi:hypothetical protein